MAFEKRIGVKSGCELFDPVVHLGEVYLEVCGLEHGYNRLVIIALRPFQLPKAGASSPVRGFLMLGWMVSHARQGRRQTVQ